MGQLSPWATTTEPAHPAGAQQQEKPPQWEACMPQLEVSPHLSPLEKAHEQQQRPSLPGVGGGGSHTKRKHSQKLNIICVSSTFKGMHLLCEDGAVSLKGSEADRRQQAALLHSQGSLPGKHTPSRKFFLPVGSGSPRESCGVS